MIRRIAMPLFLFMLVSPAIPAFVATTCASENDERGRLDRSGPRMEATEERGRGNGQKNGVAWLAGRSVEKGEGPILIHGLLI